MDPIAHTLTGAALSATGLRRTTPLATATLLVAVNAPDIDIVAQLWGPYTALAWRRGITHGIPALFILPFLVTGAILLWDRKVRLRRRPDRRRARPRAVLGLAFLGVLSHGALDWLNTYGMRWLLPFDGRWTYGDALFIIDPWLWLLLGGAGFIVFSRGLRAQIGWAVLGAAGAATVVAAPVVPTPAKALWVVGVVVVLLVRVRIGTTRRSTARRTQAARTFVALAAVYVLSMVALARAAEEQVRNHLVREGLFWVEEIMVTPSPANPFSGVALAELDDMYLRGTFRWFRDPRFRPDLPSIRVDEIPLVVEAVQADPDARNFLSWSRFPYYQIDELAEGFRIRIGDARYPGDPRVGGLRGVTVYLDRELEVMHEPPEDPEL